MKQKNQVISFVILLSGSVLSTLLLTAINTALPTIMNDMGVGAETAQWLTSGYSLVMGIMVMATAFLIKRFPTKPLFSVTMGIFALGSLIAAVATVFPVLLIGRLIQALAGGILTSNIQVYVVNSFPKEKLGTYMGICGLTVMVAPVIGPSLTGVIIDKFSWNMIFWCTLVISVILLIGGIIFVDSDMKTEKIKFDTPSMLLSAVAFTGITLGIGNISKSGFMHLNVILSLIIGIAAMVLFVVLQKRREKPFLELKLFKNSAFTWTVIGSMTMYMVLQSGTVMVPIFIQSILGYSATKSALVLLPSGIVSAIVTLIAGKMYDKYGIRKICITGAVVVLLSCLAFIPVSTETSLVYVAIVYSLRSLGTGLIMMNIVTWAMTKIEPFLVADGTSLITSLRTIAGAIGAAVFTGIMTAFAGGSALEAMAHGFSVSYIGQSIVAFILAVIAIFKIKDNQNKECNS